MNIYCQPTFRVKFSAKFITLLWHAEHAEHAENENIHNVNHSLNFQQVAVGHNKAHITLMFVSRHKADTFQ